MSNTTDNVISVYDSIANLYYDHREHLILSPEMNRFINLINCKGLILDAGCGNGRDLKIFSERDFEAVGIDASCGQLNYARNRNYRTDVKLIKSDLRKFSYYCKFDGIWCNAVLQHLCNVDIVKVLKIFNAHLESKGVILATFKKGNGYKYVVEKEFNNIVRYTNFHNENLIIDMAKEANLEVLEFDYYNERDRFGIHNRNIDFIVAIMKHHMR